MKLTGEKIFNIAILLVVLFFIVEALDFTPKARLIPLIIGVPALVLAVIQVISDYVLVKKESGSKEPSEERARQNTVLIWLLVLVGLIYVFGLLLGLALYLLLFIRFVSKESWIMSVGIGAAGFIAVYLLFVQLLHYPLYKGLLGIL